MSDEIKNFINLLFPDRDSKFLKHKWLRKTIDTLLIIAIVPILGFLTLLLVFEEMACPKWAFLTILLLVLGTFLSIWRGLTNRQKSPTLILVMILYASVISLIFTIISVGLQNRWKVDAQHFKARNKSATVAD